MKRYIIASLILACGCFPNGELKNGNNGRCNCQTMPKNGKIFCNEFLDVFAGQHLTQHRIANIDDCWVITTIM